MAPSNTIIIFTAHPNEAIPKHSIGHFFAFSRFAQRADGYCATSYSGFGTPISQ